MIQYKINTELFENYIKNSLYNEDKENQTTRQLIENLADCLKSEYLYANNIVRYKTVKNCLINWLMGLPSCINIKFYYNDIIELYKAMEEGDSFFDDLSEDNQDLALNDYFTLVAEALNSIHKKETGLNIY